MTKRTVIVAGNIGAGKTSLAERISERMGWQCAFESVSDNPTWQIFTRICVSGHSICRFFSWAIVLPNI